MLSDILKSIPYAAALISFSAKLCKDFPCLITSLLCNLLRGYPRCCVFVTLYVGFMMSPSFIAFLVQTVADSGQY